MATVPTELMTAEAFYDWATQAGNEDCLFELERGRVVKLPLGSVRHGFVCANVNGIIGNHLFGSAQGYLCSNNAGVIVERSPDTVLAPDLSFFTDGRTLADMELGYSVTVPRLVVEVLGSHDTIQRTEWRIGRFLTFGVAEVWVIDPDARTISVYREGENPQLLAATEEVSGESVMPGFRCRGASFFALPWERSP